MFGERVQKGWPGEFLQRCFNSPYFPGLFYTFVRCSTFCRAGECRVLFPLIPRWFHRTLGKSKHESSHSWGSCLGCLPGEQGSCLFQRVRVSTYAIAWHLQSSLRAVSQIRCGKLWCTNYSKHSPCSLVYVPGADLRCSTCWIIFKAEYSSLSLRASPLLSHPNRIKYKPSFAWKQLGPNADTTRQLQNLLTEPGCQNGKKPL